MADILVQLAELKELVVKKLTSVGMHLDQAQCVADVLVHADARGVRSHGTIRIEHYCNRIRKGGINLNSPFCFKSTAKAAGILDAQGGMGHYGCMLAMKEAVSRVKDTGIYAVSVQNSSHCGALSYYAEMALNAGFVSMVMVNTDKCVVPFGSAQPYFGTNPIAFGFPGKRHRILIDMATSEVAFGKIFAAREKGDPIPAHWGVDSQGLPTTDPHKVVYVTPMAAHKGTAIALAIEGVTGLFTGAFGPYISSMYGESSLSAYRNAMAFMLVLDPSVFGSADAYFNNTDKIFEDIQKLPPASSFSKVFVPGEIEDRLYDEALAQGCLVYENVLAFLKS